MALALGCVQLAVLLTREVAASSRASLLDAATGLALAHAGAIVVRRRWPQAVAGWLVVTGAAYRLLGLPPAFLGPAGLVGLYTVSMRTPRATSLPWLAASVVLVLSTWTLLSWDAVLVHSVLVAGSWVLGDQVQRRQAEAAAHASRARQLERAQLDLARAAVAEERLRIARELHDVVAHSMSVVALNAGAGRLIAQDDPDAARSALATIETVSRGALSEMRHLLAVLRDGDAVGALTPLPGLADLPQLAATVADAGLAVDVRVEGSQRILPRGLDLAAYRILQEALTNVLRHSRATTSSVLVRYDDRALALRVRDPGPTRTDRSPGSRSGLIGMRERVALYGGDLQVGPTADGGFAVEVRLPVPELDA